MPLSILDALDDPDIFAPLFKGGAASWAAWRSFLAALFALPMSGEASDLYRTHTGRTEPPATPFREATLICGRRAGKSRILALIAVYLAAFRDYAPHLAPGEVATIAVIAADRRQARNILRYVLGLVDNVDILRAMRGDVAIESVSLGDHCVIKIHTASFRAVRGYTLGAVLIDEVAFLRTDELTANPDQEILAAVRPGLSSIPGSLLMTASSPYAKRGVLNAAYRQHWAKDDVRVLVRRGPTLAMNPTLPASVVEQAYEDDAAKAAAEYGAEFPDDIASFVTREVVEACTVPGRYELPFITGNRY